MTANITTTTNTWDVNVDINASTVNVTSTPSTVELNLEPKLTLQQIGNNFFANSPLTYDSTTRTYDLDEDAIDSIVVDSIEQSDIKVKQISETVVDLGNQSGAITLDAANGTIFTADITGDITDIVLANAVAGSSYTLVLRQDGTGGHNLETGLLADWIFVDQNADINQNSLGYTSISVFYTGSKYIASLSTFDQLTTDDISEGSTNLYFTDARARASISVDAPLQYDTANGLISIDDSALFSGKTTDDLSEGNTNLYFTVDRVRSNISASGNITYDSNTGVIGESLTTTDIDEGDNLYFTDGRARQAISASGNITYDANTGVIGESLTTTDIDEGDNLYYTDARVNSFIQSSITTTDITEGTNLYYTNARVDAHLLSGAGEAVFTEDVTIQGNLEVLGNVDYVNVEDLLVKDHRIMLNVGNASAQDAFIGVDRSGSALSNVELKWNESTDAWEFTNDGNVYYPIPTSTDDLAEGSNLYFTDARARAAISGSGNITFDANTGVIGESLTTTDITEGDNLYYTNARVNAFIQDSITTTDIDEGTNLYYTDARANSAIDARVDSDYINTLTIDAANVIYDNTSSGLISTTAQSAIDELEDKKLDVTALTASVTFFPTTANSDIAGYAELVTDTADPDYNTVAANVSTGAFSGTNQLLGQLASAPGVLEGNTTPINITTIGNIRRTSGNTNDAAEFYFEVYKRDDSNVETLIGTSGTTDAVNQSTFEEFSATALITDTQFTATDRVVLKFYGSVVLGSGGRTYEFQYGGNTPTRTLFPVPVTVIPRVTSAADLTVDSAGFSGLLSTADDTAQKAFATLDGVDTDDVAEGSTNKYFTNARARASITTSDPNIEYDANTGIIGIANSLVDINSVRAESGENPQINRVDSQGRDIVGIEVDNPGWTYSTYNLPRAQKINWFSNDGNVAFESYTANVEVTAGSNVLTLSNVFTINPDQSPGTATNVSVLEGFILGFNVQSFQSRYLAGNPPLSGQVTVPFDGPVVVESVDEANSTVTVNKTATANVSFTGDNNAEWYPGGYDSVTDTALVITPSFVTFASTDPTEIYNVDQLPLFSYSYPATGFEATDFAWTQGTASDYGFNATIVADRMTARTRLTASGSYPNFTRGFTVGPETQLTNRGGEENLQTFGINLIWDGIGADFPQDWQSTNQQIAPQMLFSSFSDKTFTGGAPRLFFQSFNGNQSNDQSDWYAREGQGLGRIQWGSFTRDNLFEVSTQNPAAGIQVHAADDWLDRGTGVGIAGNTNFYMVATSNADNGNDLFLSYETGELFLASRETNGDHKPISFGPALTSGDNPTGTYDSLSTRWATVNYANATSKSGSEFSVTNGGSIGAGTVGDQTISIERKDNTGNVTVTVISSNNAKIADQGVAGVPTVFVTAQNATPFSGLNDGDPVTIGGVEGAWGNVLNGNVYYVEYSLTPVPGYRLWLDANLSQGFSAGIGGTYNTEGTTFEYSLTSGVTAKKYSFVLLEQSNDLQILVDGSLHSTIKANGEIHDASGSRYITLSDFNTLFDARLANATLDGGGAGAAPTPDYDGGDANTSSFAFTVDGGDSNTTVFTDTVEGGNAEGNSIVEGGFSSTTVYASTEDGGNANTTSFDQTIDGGTS